MITLKNKSDIPFGQLHTRLGLELMNVDIIKEIIAVNPTGRYSITFPDYLDGSEDVKIHIYDSYKNRKRFAYENNLPTDLDCSDIEIPETDEAWRHHMWTEMAKRFNWQYTYQQN